MHKRWRRFFSIFLVAALALFLLAGCGTSGKKFLNIATGGTAGTYYPIGGAMADILNKEIPGMNASAQSTGATVANINMLKDGSVDLAIVQNDIAYYAANGLEMFEDKKFDGLRGIMSLYPETCQIVTLDKSGIRSIPDLKGKKVAVGAAGSGAEANARQILAAYGLTYNDISPQYLSFGEASSALRDGNVDAAFLTAGFPTAAVQDIASQEKVRLLPIGTEQANALIAKYPFYTKTIIPKGTYQGIEEDVPAIAVRSMLVTTDKMDETMGYDITKALFDNLDKLRAAHAAAKVISKETAKEGMSIPLNAGAEKYLNGE